MEDYQVIFTDNTGYMIKKAQLLHWLRSIKAPALVERLMLSGQKRMDNITRMRKMKQFCSI